MSEWFKLCRLDDEIVSVFSERKIGDRQTVLAWAAALGGDVPTVEESILIIKRLPHLFTTKQPVWTKDKWGEKFYKFNPKTMLYSLESNVVGLSFAVKREPVCGNS